MTKGLWNRICISLLSGVLLLSAVSCGKKEQEQPKATETKEQIPETREPTYEDQLSEQFDFKQDTFRVLMLEGEIFEQKVTGDQEKDAIYSRDLAIYEKFGVNVVYEPMPMNAVVPTIEKYCMGGGDGDKPLNCVITSASALATCSQRGYLTNLTDVPTLSFQSGYWVDDYTQNCSYQSALYFAPTYASRLLYHAPHAVMFNARIAQDYDEIGNLYQCVRDDNWTLETMKEYSLLATKTDDTTGETSQYGICALSTAMYALYGGAGGTYSSLNEKGKIEVALGGEATVNILDKIIGTFRAPSTQLVEFKDAIASFTQEKALFWFSMTGFFFDAAVRNVNFDYGILPLPKLDSNQTKYISPVNPTSNYCVGMLKGQSDEDVRYSGMMIEIYNYEGYEILRPVKYDTIFRYQVAKDPEALEMLDLIFRNLYFDHNLMFNFGKSRNLLNDTMLSGTTTSYTSSYKKIVGEIEADIENYTYVKK